MPSVKNYREQGGEKWVVGGEIDVTGKASIGSTEIAAADRVVKVAKVALGVADTAGGVLAWQNPEGVDILVSRILLNVTTAATGACTIDVGMTAANATTTSDTLIDGADVGTAAGVFDNIDNAGTNGKSNQKVATGKWITASKASGAAAGLAGFAYIHYVRI